MLRDLSFQNHLPADTVTDLIDWRKNRTPDKEKKIGGIIMDQLVLLLFSGGLLPHNTMGETPDPLARHKQRRLIITGIHTLSTCMFCQGTPPRLVSTSRLASETLAGDSSANVTTRLFSSLTQIVVKQWRLISHLSYSPSPQLMSLQLLQVLWGSSRSDHCKVTPLRWANNRQQVLADNSEPGRLRFPHQRRVLSQNI